MTNEYQGYAEEVSTETEGGGARGLDATPATPVAPPPAAKKPTIPRAKYSEEFIARVAAQTAPRQAMLVGGHLVPAPAILEALIATATPMKLIDRTIGLADGAMEGWLVGGMTTIPDEIVGAVFMALYEIKSGQLEHLRGEDKELLLKLVFGLTEVAEPV